jgi:Carboxypeptidase regulatory-like domain
MRPFALAVSLLVFSVALPAQQHQAQQHPGQPVARAATHVAPARGPENPAASLPVTRVALYKNGVGFFEHTGHVSGDATVTIDFTSGQLNDVLQSLTAIDLNGGRIAGAGYNSTTPLDQQLKTLPLSLDDNPTVSDFYSAIRGAHVEVRSGSVAITGRLLSVEARSTPAKSDDNNSATVDRYFLTVVSDTGDTRTIELTSATSVRLLDISLHNDVSRYLQLIDANRSQGLRHLTLSDHGTGSRELRVSYISEVPIWKSTYRILFTNSTASSQQATLQGWSVVDNTTGADWNNVQLSLIAGAPQSFIQPLSQPIYSRRPEIAIAQEAQLTPQTYDSSLEAVGNGSMGNSINGSVVDPSGATVPGARVTVTGSDGSQQSTTTDAQGYFALGVSPGRYRVQVSMPGFQTFSENGVSSGNGPLRVTLPVGAASETVEVTAGAPMGRMMAMNPGVTGVGMGSGGNIGGGIYHGIGGPITNYQMYAENSVTPDTKSAGFDDFFEYRINQPITIRKNESALVPILQTKVLADPVTLISYSAGLTSQPLRALWVTNNSGLTLDRGSFTIIEDGNFAGEGLLDPVHPDEKRLLSYAADQAVHVAADDEKNSSHVTLIRGSRGVLNIHRAELHEVTLVLHNSAPTRRTIISEAPVVNGWKLESETNASGSDPKPVETTPTVYRFRSELAPGETTRLHIGASHSGYTTWYLARSDDNQLQLILNSSDHNPALEAALQPVLESRRKVADAQAAVDQTKANLDSLRSDEERQRANIIALKDADKSARDRFVNELNKTDDAINAAQSELTTRTAALEAAKGALASAIENLQIDTSV